MTGPAWTVLILTIATVLMKGAAALVAEIPQGLATRLGGLAPALLAALVVTELTNDAGVPQLDPRVAGVAVAVVLAWRKAPFAVCIIAAAVVAAGLRALT